LLLTRNLLTGGAERVVVTYANHLTRLRPVIGLLEEKGALLDELAPHVTREAHVAIGSPGPVQRLAWELPGETFVRLLRECLWLREVVRTHGVSVVSTFLMRAHVVALLTKRFFLPQLPVVLNIHEHMTESAPHLYPKRRDYLMMRWVTRHLFPQAERIVVVASDLQRDLVEQHGVPAEKIIVGYNPLEIEKIRAASRLTGAGVPSAGPGQQTIVAVGRLVFLKGYDLLLEAVARIRRTRDVRLILVGEGPEDAVLKEQARQLGIHNHVVFAGRLENPWAVMARADVLALTSRTEAFPNVLTEAMALGIPVLATDCSHGIRESLRDGACGVVVRSEDSGAIAEGLERLLGDPALREWLSRAGRARVEEFDAPLRQTRYEDLLLDAARSATRA
jgi:glycosyltransferase involved in cell wall biosynthesis